MGIYLDKENIFKEALGKGKFSTVKEFVKGWIGRGNERRNSLEGKIYFREKIC